jgi:hypothetical protein
VWGQWTLANAIGEALGLGATLLIGILLFARLEPALGPLGPVASLVLGVIAGAGIEGSVVGTLQWLVLRRTLAGLRWLSWAAATAIGAGIAWALGFLPSTAVSLLTTTESTQAGGGMALQDISGLASYGLAAGLGFVAGSILAVAQWWLLRRFVPRASWWIVANGAAWALGMVLVVLGMSVISTDAVTIGTAALLVTFVLVAGGVVGATQGLTLIWLLRERDREQTQTLQQVV